MSEQIERLRDELEEAANEWALDRDIEDDGYFRILDAIDTLAAARKKERQESMLYAVAYGDEAPDGSFPLKTLRRWMVLGRLSTQGLALYEIQDEGVMSKRIEGEALQALLSGGES